MEINMQLLCYVALAMLPLYMIYNRFRPSMNLPPGPRAWPVIGHLHLLGILPHRSLDRLSKSYGPLMSIKLGSVPFVVASSVEMAREILKTNDLTFASRPRIAAGKYTVYNYSDITWSPYGEHWRLARKICLMELFSTKRLESYEYIRVEEVERMVASVFRSSAAAQPVHLREETSSVSNDIISRMVLGRRYLDENGGNKIEPHEFKEMLEELFVLNGVFNIGDYIPALSFLDLQGYVRRMKKLSRRFDIFLEEVLEEHDRRRKSVPDYVPADMVDVLLQQSDDPANNLTRNKVKAFTQDMIAGGTESSATLVEWALAELLRKPENLAKANEEMDRIVGKERWVQEKDIGELEFVQGIVKETMRLHPVAPMLVPHLSTQHCKIGEYDIPANTRALVSVWTIGRDETVWEKPEEFRPERFEGSSLDVKGRDYELLPFGSGRRMCPGASLGLKVVQLGLANLLHGFHWRLPANIQSTQELDMTETYGLSTPKAEPLVAMAEPRLPHHLYCFP
ncbi:trimethyltridecatetraene synthase [Cryptomeria japonica]|uniref:trimethyltridecatetraene synthase n=1 Tax=Cryptomeria japonica TaxID=3369 RepID=UPI0027DAA02E|nr:trimethyltridecatetraene synthase [Cryptomeria japonica]